MFEILTLFVLSNAGEESRSEARGLRVPKGRQGANSVQCAQLLRLDGQQGRLRKVHRRRHAPANHLIREG